MKFDKSKLPDIVFWTSLAILVLWALAKSFGIIHTPVIIEMIPLFTIAFAAGSFWNKFLTLEREFHSFKIETAQNFVTVNNNFATVNQHFGHIEHRLDLVEEKLS